MRKILSFVFVIMLCFSFVITTVAYGVDDLYKTGDVNVDGKVSVGDVSLILKNIAGWRIGEFCSEYADADGDGDIGLCDVSLLLKFIAGWNVVLCPPNGFLQKIADDYEVYVQENYKYDPEVNGEFYVLRYYGSYDGAHAVMLDGGGRVYSQALWTDYVAESEIHYSNGNFIMVWVNGIVFTVREAYEAEYLTVDQVEKIADINNEKRYMVY